MSIPMRVSRGVRAWTCPICHHAERISTKRRHPQTGQALSTDEQIRTLACRAEEHWRTVHRNRTLAAS